MHDLALFVGQSGQECRSFGSESLKCIGLYVASQVVIDFGPLARLDSSADSPPFIDELVSRDREQQCHECVIVAEEGVDSTEHCEERLIGDPFGVLASLRCSKGGDLTAESVPQPFESGCLAEPGGVDRAGERWIIASVLCHEFVFDETRSILEETRGQAP